MKMNLQFFGGRGASSSKGGGGLIATQLPPAPSIPAAINANNAVFSDTDSQGFHDLYNGRGYFQKQNLTIDQQLATIDYLSDTKVNDPRYSNSLNPNDPNYKGSTSQYSISQHLNWDIATGANLTTQQIYMRDSLDGAMHNLGYNVNLHRYDHPDLVNGLLKQSGLSMSYNKYSEAQLKKALVGTTFNENKYISTSYNNFSNALKQSRDVFTTRNIKVNYRAKASTQAYMPGDGMVKLSGSNKLVKNPLGEIVLGRNQQQRIVDVKYNGKMSRMKGTQSFTMPQLEITVEIG